MRPCPQWGQGWRKGVSDFGNRISTKPIFHKDTIVTMGSDPGIMAIRNNAWLLQEWLISA